MASLSRTLRLARVPVRAVVAGPSTITFRSMATTHRRLAQHSHEHNSMASGNIRSPSLRVGTQGAEAEPDKYINPYKGGPSAVDKAVHLFFFTEIIRGEPCKAATLDCSDATCRDVDCIGELLPRALHHQISL
jgi:NADH dehydrogenase (ubiquinone) Fe-S protein 8